MMWIFGNTAEMEKREVFNRYIFLHQLMLVIDHDFPLSGNYIEACRKIEDMIILGLIQGTIKREQLLRLAKRVLRAQKKVKGKDIAALVDKYLGFALNDTLATICSG